MTESFNLFLNFFKITFESCLPMQYVTNKVSNNHWITTGIKISCKRKKYLYIMNKTTNCSKIKIQYFRVLRKVIRKAKEMYNNELLSLPTNKSKTSWNIINNEIGTVSSKKFTQNEFKLGNKIKGTNQSAKIFNNYFINSVDKLITGQPNTESVKFLLRESFPYEFPQIINIPIISYHIISYHIISYHIISYHIISYLIISYHINSPSIDLYRYGIHHTLYISMQSICHNTTIQ